MLLRTDHRRNAWHIAAFEGKLNVMQKIWKQAKERLTRGEIKNEILLVTDHEGRNVWYITAYGGELVVMQKMWELLQED